MKKLIIIGVGGMGRETAWLAKRINNEQNTWDILGFLDDDPSFTGKTVNGYKVLGKTDEVVNYPDAYFVCAVGVSAVREKIIKKITAINPEIKFATLIDPSVIMSDSVSVSSGSIICAGSVLTVDVKIDKHVIVNTGCTVGHDAVIGEFAMIYPGANIAGNVNIGKVCEIGTGAQIIQGKTIGNNTIIGAGAVVINDMPCGCTAVGVPAKPIKFQ